MSIAIRSSPLRHRLLRLCAGCIFATQCVLQFASRGHAAEAANVAAAPPASQELMLGVTLNGQKISDAALIVRDSDGRLLVPSDELASWRLIPPTAGPVTLDGDAFYRLDALTGLSYTVDESTQMLSIDAGSGLFPETRLSGSGAPAVAATAPPPGGFVNYDMSVTSSPERTAVSGLLELAFFNAWGVGVTSVLHQTVHPGPREIRLSSTWTRDRPSDLSSDRIGDLITTPGSWGNPVRIGGIQSATNFATQPGYITFPLPQMAGDAALPSTMDLYVNDALRLRRKVPTGPFSIDDIPVFTGKGEARLVVTDLLGRQQVIKAPYYAAPTLLKPGLHAYSWEAGAIRRGFGLVSNDYGRLLAVGTYRSGLTERITGEVHAEILVDQQTVGLGGVFLWPAAGVFSASLAISNSKPQTGGMIMGDVLRSPGGSGGLLALAFQGQSRWLSYGITTQVASAAFTQAGQEVGALATPQSTQIFLGVSSRRLGSMSLNYVLRQQPQARPVRLASANYGITLGNLGFLSASVLHIMGAEAESIYGLSFTRMLGTRTTASASATMFEDRTEGTVRMQRSLPSGNGFGYRIAAGVGDSDRQQAGLNMQNRIGTYALEASTAHGRTSYRGSASGGVAVLGGDAFLSRRISSSFAVVQVPGYPNIGIYQDNQAVARTNASGSALVARLRPYQVNTLRIEQADLPMNAQIDALALKVVPYFRSGLALAFAVRRSRGAELRIVFDDGEPAPAGATAVVNTQPEPFPVGMRGMLYATGLEVANRIVVEWLGQHCEFAVDFPESEDPLPDLGTFQCSGITR